MPRNSMRYSSISIGLFTLWLTGGMLMWPWCADDSPNRFVPRGLELLHDLVCCNGKCRRLLLSDAVVCCLVAQVSAS